MQFFDVKIFNDTTNDNPVYAKPGDSGMDVRCKTAFSVLPGETKIIQTGLYFSIPKPGLEIQVRPRSGMSYKTKMRIANSPGTIDSAYTGELGIIFDNIGDEPFNADMGERIAQIVLCPVYGMNLVPVASKDDLGKTERGAGGLGHTGTK